MTKTAVVVTSIFQPNAIMKAIAKGSVEQDWQFIVVGDTKSPADYTLEGAAYYSMEAQLSSGLKFAEACPTRHYARKNIGYLLAIKDGVELMLETDDDNMPRAEFFAPREAAVEASVLKDSSWVNVYRYFTDALIWPRGLPLDNINEPLPDFEGLPQAKVHCPIQQGLADENPDVDAIYRLLLPLPQSFRGDRRVALGSGAWCPFNSQNTAWWPEAFPLLYLPAYCSFRMTDIWRSFVAQRILWANDWHLLFHEATVYQERNEHNLMRDFADEVSGYLNNRQIVEALEELPIKAGQEAMPDNLRLCYEKLVEMELIGKEELPLLDAWLADFAAVKR